jgi:hypothetical protein
MSPFSCSKRNVLAFRQFGYRAAERPASAHPRGARARECWNAATRKRVPGVPYRRYFAAGFKNDTMAIMSGFK